jgi:hypothetical protein
MIKRYALIVLTAFFIYINLDNSLLFAQSISSIEIIPENPTSMDEVMLVVHTSFEFEDCRLDSLTPYFACGAFSFNGFYSSSFNADSCFRSDTLSLGVLENGMYIISYRMHYLGWTQVDHIDTSFVVGTTGLEKLVYQAERKQIKTWPNPSTGDVHIMCSTPDIDKIMVHSIHGQQCMILSKEDRSEIWQNTISLQAGNYICTAYKNDFPVAVTKIIVTDK